MVNKNDSSPSIEQSLKMIEEKLSLQKGKKKQFKTNGGKEKKTSLSNLFENNKKNIKKSNFPKEKEEVLLLTKKIGEPKKTISHKNKVLKKSKNISKMNKEENVIYNIKDPKNLSKTTDLAVIIKKLKKIRDKKLVKKKGIKSKKINKEIKNLNETINLAEDLFKKELLDL